MDQKNFEVTLNTPLGKRQGTMELFIEEKTISGTLCLFQNEEPVYGRIDGQGNCTLHGRFRTLKNLFYYEAEGKIRGGSLELTLCGGRNVFQMQGKSVEAYQETEEDGGNLHPAGKGGELI